MRFVTSVFPPDIQAQNTFLVEASGIYVSISPAHIHFLVNFAVPKLYTHTIKSQIVNEPYPSRPPSRESVSQSSSGDQAITKEKMWFFSRMKRSIKKI